MVHFKGLVPVALVALVAAAGCAAPSQDEAVGAAGESALTQSAAFDAVVGTEADGKTFKSGGASACGHSITLTRSTGPAMTGEYAYRYTDCEYGGGMQSRGTFKVVGGYLGGLLTDPTLEITPVANPSRPDDDTTPWSYKIRTNQSEDGQLPKGAIYLESTSAHVAKLYPEGLSS